MSMRRTTSRRRRSLRENVLQTEGKTSSLLRSNSTVEDYHVLERIGEGSFGKCTKEGEDLLDKL
jgi:hypothetical protein